VPVPVTVEINLERGVATSMSHEVMYSDSESAQRLRDSLRQRLGQERFQLWFGACQAWQVTLDQVRLEFASQAQIDWIRGFCWEDLTATVEETLGTGLAVRLEAQSGASGSQADGSVDRTTAVTTSGGETIRGKLARRSDASEVAVKQTGGVEANRGAAGSACRGDSEASVSSAGGAPPARSTKESKPTGGLAAGRSIRSRTRTTVGSERNQPSEEMVKHPGNMMAITAADMVLESPGSVSPLLLYGPSGVGKTHLLRQIAERLRDAGSNRRVLYLTSEQFMVDYADSVRGSGFASFRAKYRGLDALLIDDLQGLLNKPSMLTELRHTVDSFLRQRKQLVFAADRSLAELSNLGTELYTRLSGGMACAVGPLELDAKVEVLRRFCRQRQLEVIPDIARQLCSAVHGDARVLQGIANRLMTLSRIHGDDFTFAQAQLACRDLLEASQPLVNLADIERVVCEAFGIDSKKLRMTSKSKAASQPRMLAMFLARRYTRSAYAEIGQYFGNRKHSTVIAAEKKVQSWLDDNRPIEHPRGNVPLREMLRSVQSHLRVG
jgi:chromosomal replication initiator protein